MVRARRSAPVRRVARVFAVTAVLSAVTAAVFGCTSTVRPPHGPLAAPVTVLCVFDARHRGLVLPRAHGGYVEYGFGDFAWYAEMEDAWYDVFPTVLWPTRGTLGRREIAADDADGVRRRLSWVRLEAFEVERDRAEALLLRLDAQFEAGRTELVTNPTYGLDFVPTDDGYWCLFNCNDAVAAWVTELGCEVGWVPLRLDIEVSR